MIVHETPRLLLMNWTFDDFDGFASLARDPIVMRYIAEGEPWPDARIGWFLGLQCAFQKTLAYCNWKMVDRASMELLGFCGLAPLDSVGEVEVGWWLKPAFWGRGLAFEAAGHVLGAGFKQYGLERIVARAYQTNHKSVALIERLNMRFDRVLGEGPQGAILLYSLCSDDWRRDQ